MVALGCGLARMVPFVHAGSLGLADFGFGWIPVHGFQSEQTCSVHHGLNAIGDMLNRGWVKRRVLAPPPLGSHQCSDIYIQFSASEETSHQLNAAVLIHWTPNILALPPSFKEKQ